MGGGGGAKLHVSATLVLGRADGPRRLTGDASGPALIDQDFAESGRLWWANKPSKSSRRARRSTRLSPICAPPADAAVTRDDGPRRREPATDLS